MLASLLRSRVTRLNSKQLHFQLLTKHLHRTFPKMSRGLELKTVVEKLEELAPTRFAAPWDNVGLLVEPTGAKHIKRIFLTIDLTESVMNEALMTSGDQVDMIISYHPPIFHPLKRLTQRTAKERVILQAIEKNIAIYSPHTALDSKEGGINDWLLSGVGKGHVSALDVLKKPRLPNIVSVERVKENELSEVVMLLSTAQDLTALPSKTEPSTFDVSLHCSDSVLASVLPDLYAKLPRESVKITANQEVDVGLTGGKLLTLSQPLPLSEVVDNIKKHLELSHVRLARPSRLPQEGGEDPVITTVATCAGSGASVLKGVEADLYLTGEMSHHEVLEATGRGVTVVLCEHSNTERGYLKVYLKQVEQALGLRLGLARYDREPLQIV